MLMRGGKIEKNSLYNRIKKKSNTIWDQLLDLFCLIKLIDHNFVIF